MFSKFKRIGTQASKVQLIVDLREITIVDDRDDINLICIEIRRGNKSISSSSKLWSDDIQPPLIVDEQLVLNMTLYKDSKGMFIEKTGKLYLNGHSVITNSSLRLGSVDLKLHLMVSDFSARQYNLALLNSNGVEMGRLVLHATARFLSDGYADDEGCSMTSGVSGISAKSIIQKDVKYAAVYRDNTGIDLNCV